jgi:hypothetical protein
MKKLKFKLNNETFNENHICDNHLGFDKIEILRFNYDGMGNALATCDGEMKALDEDDLFIVLHSGWYMQDYVISKKIKLSFERQDEQPSHFEKKHNYLGFDNIEVIEFNYDSEGNALVFEDGELGVKSQDSLRFIFFSGWYKLKPKIKVSKKFKFNWN